MIELNKKEWKKEQIKIFVALMLIRFSATAAFILFCHYTTKYLIPRMCYPDRNDFVAYGVVFFLVSFISFLTISILTWIVQKTWKKADELVAEKHILRRY